MRGFKPLVAVVAVSLLAASCGSDDKAATTTAAGGSTAASTSAGGGSGLEAAKAAVAKYSSEQQPIGITKPLTKKPEKKKFAYLQCELESCMYGAEGAKAATAALGWELILISSKSATPAPAFQQAIDAGADFIASTGEAPSLYKDQAKLAADKGIKILSCFDTTPPDGPGANIWTQCGDTSFVEKTGPLMANWAIADSNGKAHPLIVSIPDFAVLKAETDAYIAEFKKNCADCKYDELNVSINDLVGGNERY